MLSPFLDLYLSNKKTICFTYSKRISNKQYNCL